MNIIKKIRENHENKKNRESPNSDLNDLNKKEPSTFVETIPFTENELLEKLDDFSYWDYGVDCFSSAWDGSAKVANAAIGGGKQVFNSVCSFGTSAIEYYKTWFPEKTQTQIHHEQTLEREKAIRASREAYRKQSLENRNKIIADSYKLDLEQLNRELDICYRWNEDEKAFLEEIHNRLKGEAFFEDGKLKPMMEANQNSNLRPNRGEVLCEDMGTTMNQHKLEMKSSTYDDLCSGLDSRINQLITEKKQVDQALAASNQKSSNLVKVVQEKLELTRELQTIKNELNQCLEVNNAEQVTSDKNPFAEFDKLMSEDSQGLVVHEDLQPDKYVPKDHHYASEKLQQNLHNAKIQSGLAHDEFKLVISRFINMITWPRYLLDVRSLFYSEFPVAPSLKFRYLIASLVSLLWVKILWYLFTAVLDYLFYKPQKSKEIEEPAFRPWSRIPRGGDILNFKYPEDFLPFFIIKLIQVKNDVFITHNEDPNPISKIYKIGSRIRLPLNSFFKNCVPIIVFYFGISRTARPVAKPEMQGMKPAIIRDISTFQSDDLLIDSGTSLNLKTSNGILKLKLESRRQPLTMKQFEEKSCVNKKQTPRRNLSKVYNKKRNRIKKFENVFSTEDQVRLNDSSLESPLKIKNKK